MVDWLHISYLQVFTKYAEYVFQSILGTINSCVVVVNFTWVNVLAEISETKKFLVLSFFTYIHTCFRIVNCIFYYIMDCGLENNFNFINLISEELSTLCKSAES